MAWTLLFIFPAFITSAAQEVQPQADQAESTGEPALGLWPSPRLIELMITRWAEEASDEYDLDETQREYVREAAVKRWSEFAAEHEGELQPLLNEFLEMRLGLSPPEKDRVQSWAGKALPVFEQVRDELFKTTDDFRAVMRPEQRAKLEVEVFKRRTGLQLAENKLRHWSQGNIQPEDLWEPIGESRRARRERRNASENQEVPETTSAQAAKPVDQIAVELGSWELYVQAFVSAYGLDEAQRATALSCLKELQERAGAHRDAHRKEIEELERRIQQGTQNDEVQAAIKRQVVELYGPVDAMFQELKTRLDAVLTSEQRARVQFRFPPDGPTRSPEAPDGDASKTKRRQND